MLQTGMFPIMDGIWPSVPRRNHDLLSLIEHRINDINSKTCLVIYFLRRKMDFYKLWRAGGWCVGDMEVLACRCCVLVKRNIVQPSHINDDDKGFSIRLIYDVPIHSYSVIKNIPTHRGG